MILATSHHRARVHECLVLGACAAAIVLCLPLLALALFMLRPLVLGAAILAIVAIASPWVLVPRLRGRWGADLAPEHAYRGLRLARDVAMHPGHAWVWIGEGEAVVGADDIVQAEIGPLDEVVLPAEGRHVHQGEALFRIRRGDRSIEVPSPVGGEVVRTNGRLLDHPELINSRPFSLGWVTRIRVDDDVEDQRRALLFGRPAWRWFRTEVDRLLAAVTPSAQQAPASDEPAGPGEGPADDLYRRIDDGAWDRLRRKAERASA